MLKISDTRKKHVTHSIISVQNVMEIMWVSTYLYSPYLFWTSISLLGLKKIFFFFTPFRILLKWESRECCGRTAYSDLAVRYEVELWSWCDKRRTCRQPWIDIIFKMKDLIQSCGGSSVPEHPIRCAHHCVTLSGYCLWSDFSTCLLALPRLNGKNVRN